MITSLNQANWHQIVFFDNQARPNELTQRLYEILKEYCGNIERIFIFPGTYVENNEILSLITTLPEKMTKELRWHYFIKLHGCLPEGKTDFIIVKNMLDDYVLGAI